MKLLDCVESGVRMEPPRLWIYGTQGIGKTTMAASFPGKPIVADIEGGASLVDCARTPLITSFAQFSGLLRELAEDEHDYTALVIDSTTALEQLIWTRVAADKGVDNITEMGFGKGYAATVDKWREVCAACDYLRSERNMAILLVGHSQVERIESPETDTYDMYTPRLYRTASALLREWVDAVMFATYRVHTVTKEGDFGRKTTKGIGTGDRILRTQERPYCVAKNRYDWPFELPLDKPFDWARLFPNTTQTNKKTEN